MGDTFSKLFGEDSGAAASGGGAYDKLFGGGSKMTVGEPEVLKYGALEAPTLDLTNRPRVKNDDGSISTVRSMGVNVDGKEYLIPTVSDDGRIMSDDEAFDTFRKGGKHLGVYASPEASDSAAERIHLDQEKMYATPQPEEGGLKGMLAKLLSGDENYQAIKNGTSDGQLQRDWEKSHGAPIDEVGADAMKTYTDPSVFAQRMGGAGLKLGLGAATAGTSPLSMLSTILTGSGTGGVAAPIASKAGPTASLGARALGSTVATGKDVASQGAQGAVAAAADSMQAGDDQATMFKRIKEAGGTGGLIELATSVLGGAGEKAGKGMEWAAQKAKNVVAGSNAKEAGAIIDKYGATADTDMLGKLLDKYSPTGVFSPKSAAQHLETSVAPQAQVQGQRVGQMIDKAGYDEGVNALVPDAFGKFQGSVDDRALEAMRRPAGGESEDFASAMANRADTVHKMEPPQDLAEFVGDKSGFQSSGAGDNAVGFSEKARAKADQAVGGIAKDSVAGLMSNAEPGTFARWDDARGQKHELEMLKEVLANKKAGESTAGDIGSTIGSAVVGAGLGGVAGAATGDGDNALWGAGLGAGGALAGAFGLTGGATKTAVRQMGGSGLADFGANVARSGGKTASALGDFAGSFPTGATSAAAFDAQADSDKTKGYKDLELIKQALQSNPRLLGSYGPRLQQSQDLSGDYSRLMDDDPQFQRMMKNVHATMAGMQR